MVEMVTCSNGHRFPVNKDKHLDRDYRICPRKGCRERVKVRSKWSFLPSVHWPRIKEEIESNKRLMKELKRHPPEPVPAYLMDSARVTASMVTLAAAKMMKEQKEQNDAHRT